MLTMPISAVMQPDMVQMAGRRPKRAPWLMTKSMLGPGVADTTKVISTKSHHVCKPIDYLEKNHQKSIPIVPRQFQAFESLLTSRRKL